MTKKKEKTGLQIAKEYQKHLVKATKIYRQRSEKIFERVKKGKLKKDDERVYYAHREDGVSRAYNVAQSCFADVIEILLKEKRKKTARRKA